MRYMAQPGAPPAAWQGPIVQRTSSENEFNNPPRTQKFGHSLKVSQLVIARRALHFGFIDRAHYLAVAEASRKAAGKSGGNPYNTLPVRNSKRFTKALVASAMIGETLLRDAGSLLSVTPNTVVELGRRR